MEHLVYCDAKARVLEKLLNGTKTMIVRGAAGRKLPYGRVFTSDPLYFIENNGSGLILAKGVVASVINTGKMTPEESADMLRTYQDKLQLTPQQTGRWSGKKFLCLIEVAGIKAISPLQLNHQKNMDDWITVEEISQILEDSGMTYQAVRLH